MVAWFDGTKGSRAFQEEQREGQRQRERKRERKEREEGKKEEVKWNMTCSHSHWSWLYKLATPTLLQYVLYKFFTAIHLERDYRLARDTSTRHHRALLPNY